MFSVLPTELNSIAKLLADASLKAYYRFSAGALVTDEKATYTLTNVNSVLETTDGKHGGGANFGDSNTNKYFNIGTGLNSSLKRSNAFSFSAWIKTASATNQDIITNSDWDSPYCGVEFILNSAGTLRVDLGQNDTKLIRVTGTITVNDGTWHHVVMTYSGSGAASGIAIWIDGVKDTLTTGSDNTDADFTSSTNLQIGARDGANQIFKGQMDDVAIFGKVLDRDEIKLLAGYTTSATEIAKSWLAGFANLKLHFKFDETSGTSVTDSSGNSHTGTASNASIIANIIGGIFNNKALFNSGASDKITLSDHADLKPTGDFTVGAWIRTGTALAQYIFQSYNYNSAPAFDQGIIFCLTAAGKIQSICSGASVVSTTSDTAVYDGLWHHVVWSHRSNVDYIYIDGKLDKSQASVAPTYNATNYVRVGNGKYDGGSFDGAFFNGWMDDLFLLNGTGLSSEQVRELYEGRNPGELYPAANLKFLYHFNGNSKDFSGNGIEGSDVGGMVYSLANGKHKHGVSFNGSNARILFADNLAGIKLTGNWTFTGWIKAANTVDGGIFQSGTSFLAGTTGFYVTMNGGKLYVCTGNGSAYRDALTTITIDNNVWTHVAAVWDGTNINLYINGRLAKQAVGYNASYSGTNYGRIGCWCNAGSDAGYLTGALDELALFDRAFSAHEIANLYLKSVGKIPYAV